VIQFPADVKLADIQENYTREDLIEITNDIIDRMLDCVRGIPDSFVTFTPIDPEADDPWAATEHELNVAWTLAHVIVHATASAEERASHGSMLARGTQIKGRNRYEIPWQTITTTERLVDRLEESRRMRLAFYETWPDEPHLENIYDQRTYVEKYGPMNAVGMTLFGLKHDIEHLPQIAEIVRQAREALS
jgi:hypothetical protein